MEINEKIVGFLSEVKKMKPLVHNITNYVTTNDCANIILAIGGSPVMADAIEEVEDMVNIASALVINIGTLNSRTVEAMILAGKRANKNGIPVVLDPVGVGATPYRKEVALKLIKEINFSIIRGNMAEIKVLSGLEALSKGVDSEESSEDGKEVAINLSRALKTVVAITGVIDFISNGEKVIAIENGHEMLTKVTGTGCMSTCLIGVYAGVTKDYLAAATAGIMTMGIAGEKAYEKLNKSEGNGSFKVLLMDNIYNFSSQDIIKRGKANEL
ncbi:MAG: hydroxyethylthiazole kinase [Clostridiaceae bacterium]|nr:hydroxyethylthiazole kinase [Clostridiaceae bacterium]